MKPASGYRREPEGPLFFCAWYVFTWHFSTWYDPDYTL